METLLWNVSIARSEIKSPFICKKTIPTNMLTFCKNLSTITTIPNIPQLKKNQMTSPNKVKHKYTKRPFKNIISFKTKSPNNLQSVIKSASWKIKACLRRARHNTTVNLCTKSLTFTAINLKLKKLKMGLLKSQWRINLKKLTKLLKIPILKSRIISGRRTLWKKKLRTKYKKENWKKKG